MSLAAYILTSYRATEWSDYVAKIEVLFYNLVRPNEKEIGPNIFPV